MPITPTSQLKRVLPALLLCLAAAIAQADDKAEIEQLLNGLHADASAARFDSYFNRYTDDAIFLGTDRSERWTIDQFKAYARPHFEAGRGWTYDVKERHVMGGGEMRWFDEVLWNTKYGHCRGTGVVVKTTEGWRLAHYSLSFLIPNDAASEVGELTRKMSEDTLQR